MAGASSLDLRLRISVENRQLRAGLHDSGRAVQQFGQQTQDAVSGIGNSLRSIAAQLAGLFAVNQLAQSVRDVIGVADAWSLLQAKLQASMGSQQQAVTAMRQLFQIAQDTRTPVESLGTLYVRLASSAKRLGVEQSQLSDFTKLVAQSLKLSGATAGEAASVIRQLSQAMASGLLRGDEFNSIMENGFVLANVLAEQLGVTTGELRAMAEAGSLTADKVFNALLMGANDVNNAFAKLPVTVDAAITQMANAWQRYVGETNTGLQATQKLASALQTVATNIGPLVDASLTTSMVALAIGVGKVTTATIARTNALRDEIATQRIASANAVARAETELTAARAAAVAEQQARSQARLAIIAQAEAQVVNTRATLDGARATYTQVSATTAALSGTAARLAQVKVLAPALADVTTAERAHATAQRELQLAQQGVVASTQSLSAAEIQRMRNQAAATLTIQRRIIVEQQAAIAAAESAAAATSGYARQMILQERLYPAKAKLAAATQAEAAAELQLARARLSVGVNTERLTAAQARYAAATTAAAGATTLLGRATSFLLGPWGMAIALLATFGSSFIKFSDDATNAKRAIDEFGGSIENAVEKIRALQQSEAAATLSQKSLVEAVARAKQQYDGSAASIQRIRKAEEELATATQKTAAVTAETSKGVMVATDEAARAHQSAIQAVNEHESSLRKLREQLGVVGVAYEQGRASTQQLKAAEDSLLIGRKDLVLAQDKLQNAERVHSELIQLSRDRESGLAQVTQQRATNYASVTTAVDKARGSMADHLKMLDQVATAELNSMKSVVATARARGDFVAAATASQQAIQLEIAQLERRIAYAQADEQAQQTAIRAREVYLRQQDQMTAVEALGLQQARAALSVTQAEIKEKRLALDAKRAEVDVSAAVRAAAELENQERARSAKSLEQITQSTLEQLTAARDLAVAKHQLATASRLNEQIARLEIKQLEDQSRARLDAAQHAKQRIDQLEVEREQLGKLEPAKERELAQLQRERAENDAGYFSLKEKIELKKEEEKAALGGWGATKLLADQLEKERLAREAASSATREHAQASAENAQALEQQSAAASSAGGIAQMLSQKLNNARAEMRGLSAAAGEYFEQAFLGAQSEVGLGIYFQKLKPRISDVSDELERLKFKISEQGQLINAAKQWAAFGDSISDYEAAIALAAARTRIAYYQQQADAERLARALDNVGKSGTAHLYALEGAARALSGELGLLNENDLSRLRGALEAANERLREMQELAQSAAERLSELKAENLELSGNKEQADLLRLQNEYTQDALVLEAELAKAKASNNRDAIRDLEQSINLLKQNLDLKERDIRAENSSGKNKSTKSSNSGGGVSQSGGGSIGGSGSNQGNSSSKTSGGIVINISAPNAGVLTRDFIEQITPGIKRALNESDRRLR